MPIHDIIDNRNEKLVDPINRELNLLRQNGVTGPELLKTLARLYHQHNMKDWLDHRSLQME